MLSRHAFALAVGALPFACGGGLQAAPVDPEPIALRLVIDCPSCGRPAPYPGRAGDGSPALAECAGHRCDIFFDFDLADVYVARV